MEDFAVWFSQYWPAVAGSVTAVASALATWFVYRIKLRTEKEKNAVLVAELRKANIRNTYTICPHCGVQVPLEELKWFMPGQIPDQNLNGQDDRLEH